MKQKMYIFPISLFQQYQSSQKSQLHIGYISIWFCGKAQESALIKVTNNPLLAVDLMDCMLCCSISMPYSRL